ncbi:MAG: hypothetical protein QOI06_98 [Nocardioidaceae bacterium]|nr:hypothetical protein [Nocardioidaceae bacterium]
MTTVHVVVPDGIDDPARPSGGNAYDRRISLGLAAIGWTVREHAMRGSWPRPDALAKVTLTRAIAGIPDGGIVLVDGLIASTVPEVLVPESRRLRLVVLVHMPLGEGTPGAEPPAGEVSRDRAREGAVLSAAVAVVSTSAWTRRRLLDRYRLLPGRVHVAEPGVDVADVAFGTEDGAELLCVAAVTPAKGQDVLLEALSGLTDLCWHCLCVGSLARDPVFADRLRHQAEEYGLAERISLAGPRTADDLGRAYAAADVLVLASRAETYGMVVTEALARGVPVVASNVGGVPEALGQLADGSRPGVLVPPGDIAALAGALRGWLVDRDLRQRLRSVARERRASLPDWSTTTDRISWVLAEVAS